MVLFLFRSFYHTFFLRYCPLKMTANQLENVESLGNWVEAIDRENRNSAQKRVEIVEDGIKMVIDYVDEKDKDGSIIGRSKVITTYKVVHKKVPSVVAERKKWKKFGESRDDGPGPNIGTTYVADNVEIQFVNRFGEKQDEYGEKMANPLLKGQKGSHCRRCKLNDHWSVNCPYKEMFAGMEEESQKDGADKRGDANRMTGGGDRYIPPAQRGGGAGSTAAGEVTMGEHRSEDYTVRITNLPEDSDSDTLEDDLRAMFGKAGKILRFHLPRVENKKRQKEKEVQKEKEKEVQKEKEKEVQKEKEIEDTNRPKKGRPKGFAFATFATAQDAERAIQMFNGGKMEHRILKVDWTKPSK